MTAPKNNSRKSPISTSARLLSCSQKKTCVSSPVVGKVHADMDPDVRRATAAPFVKWAGGKRSLIPYLSPHFQERIGHYWEPFVGGGAVFFNFADRIDRATLSDINEELILTYQTVKDNVDSLVEALRCHAAKHAAEDNYYTKVRKQSPKAAIEIAARFIYLNKTCYNGLYRVNSAGKFNVPKGSYKKPNICDEERLRNASKVLAKANILIGDFGEITTPSRGDFIYCDPPYNECFTQYQARGFDGAEQTRLKNEAGKWVKAGAKVVLSNSDTPLIRRLYGRGFEIHEAAAPRHINRNGNGRGATAEIIAVAESDGR